MFHFKDEKISKQKQLKLILQWIDEAEAVVIGGASGMSTASGFDYYSHHTPLFEEYFSDFGKIYHEPSCWQLLYHPYNIDEERWAYMARNGCIMLNLLAELIPRCPVCGGAMGSRVKSFIFQYRRYWKEESHAHKKVLFLALGIGRMTPEFIKIPFINMTYSLPDARLVLINKGEAEPLAEIAGKTIALDADILETLHTMVEMKKEAVSCA